MTIWSLCDLQTLLERERGVVVSVYTLHRVVHALGYRYQRPRHDLRHRQDAEAVAAAKWMLDWLEKKRCSPQRLHLVYLDECEVYAHLYLAKV